MVRSIRRLALSTEQGQVEHEGRPGDVEVVPVGPVLCQSDVRERGRHDDVLVLAYADGFWKCERERRIWYVGELTPHSL